MNPGTLLIRADASIAIGTGHVMRCLALAQAWQDAGGTAIAVMTESTSAIENRLRGEGIEVLQVDGPAGSEADAQKTASLALERDSSWVVVDGYRFNSAYQVTLKEAGLRILLVDDGVHADYYAADLVLNQNPTASAELYARRAPHTRLLLGTSYAMLRRQFVIRRDWHREIAMEGRKVLVTMGGSDPDNFTSRVLESLEASDVSFETVVVIGGSNPHADQMESEANARGHNSIRVMKNVSNMPELMMWADVAVSAAGTTCWEICFLGLPALLVDLAENQVPVARSLDSMGVARHLGSSQGCVPAMIEYELKRLAASAEDRRRMCLRGREVVDGMGASRVCAIMLDKVLRLRSACESDCYLLWEWANEAAVRASSFSQQSIGREEHDKWFRARLADTGCTILIAENEEGRPVGQVRFDVRPGESAEIDVSVGPDFRGCGYGGTLINMAAGRMFATTRISRLDAFIRVENLPSIRAFERAGFRRVGEIQVRGQAAFHYRRERQRSPDIGRSATHVK